MRNGLALAAALAAGGAALLLAHGGCKSVATLAPETATITLFASPSAIGTGATATLTASVFEATGQPVPDDTVITFTTNLGSVEPEQARVRGGFVQATYRAPATAGTATITARSGNAPAATTTVRVGATAFRITAAASPATLPVGGGSTTITATVVDDAGVPIPRQTVVFSTDRGTLASGGAPRLTDASGQARDTLTTGADTTVTVRLGSAGGTATPTPSAAASPTATATATSTPGSAPEARVFVDVAGSGAATLTLTASPASLGPGGGTTTLVATAKDASGTPVAGLPVAFSSTAGSLGTAGPVRTDSLGRASTTLTTAARATVTATGPGVEASVDVSVGNPTPGSVSVTLVVSPTQIVETVVTPTPAQVAACADPLGFDLTLTATVRASGTPVAGALVVFFTSQPTGSRARIVGRFCESPPQAVTDANGVATLHYTISQGEIAACDDVAVPCAGAACASPSPCGMPTPTPAGTPTGINDCCCGIVFNAQVGSTRARAPVPAFRVLADQDCAGSKLCGCVFF